MRLSKNVRHFVVMMLRHELEQLTSVQLSEKLVECDLLPQGTRQKCIEALLAHYEKNPPQLIDMRGFQGTVTEQPSLSLPHTSTVTMSDSPSTHSGVSISNIVSSAAVNTVSSDSSNQISQLCALFAEQFKFQQEMLAQFMATGKPCVVPAAPVSTPNPFGIAEASQPVRILSPSPGRDSLALRTSIQAVTLLATQLPEFKGSEDEDIDLWLSKVKDIAEIHGASPEIMLLAASSKLTQTARKWFDLSSSSIRKSWNLFEDAIRDRFRRTVMYHVQLQKIEARSWNHQKESFQDYAMEKMVLIEPLKLPDRETIQLLINGIGSAALRSVATLTSCNLSQSILERDA